MGRALVAAVLVYLAAADQPATKAEWDRLTLVGKRDETITVRHIGDGVTTTRSLELYRARTKYGRYSRLGNTVIATLPDGRLGYFAYDEHTGKAVNVLDAATFTDPGAPGFDKRVVVPDSCVRCHRGRFVPE
jgi:hypothetical protein